MKHDTFTGTCPRCSGSGLWNDRPGYECFGCSGTGRITVAIVPGANYSTYHVVSAKGNVTKETYFAPAVLAEELRRWEVRFLNSGRHVREMGVNPVGATCHVYGHRADGHLLVVLPGGGFSSTEDHGYDGTDGSTKAPEVLWAEPVERTEEGSR